ncbi:6-phosphogluconate dehydrogenase [Dictyobacter sp. S3.2.2.5]|uniref:6-phosphogluconate dehydrogenase n=1 Tax=Dictyobacter halimunensis TaxID=3026934 RepID=A0ABQ6G4Y0_9CHLR|nr:6-phosphogluconate dehydrogenase [Dictyobacter sp. S3.2.2.5]
MDIQTVGILSPGDMGHAIGGVLRQAGLRVISCLRDRSPRTRELASQAGIVDVESDEALVREADIVLSVLVPARAVATAERIAVAVRATGARPLFADCNAISPRTMQAINQIVTESGADVVDIGIIGGPPRGKDSGTRLYASGPRAAEIAALNNYGLDIRVLGDRVGQASGLKMCYASITKGLTALATEALTAGQALGIGEALTGELKMSQATLLSMFERQIPGMPPKAYRWVGEMEEIAQTFGDLGLPPQMLQGAANVYRLVEQTELGAEIPEQRRLGTTRDEVTTILNNKLGHATTQR